MSFIRSTTLFYGRNSMLRVSLFCAALLPALVQGSWSVTAQAADQPSPTADAVPHYVPPMRGAPGGRTGGGSRGAKGPDLSVAVLAPDHVGLTAEDQPTLYWYASSPVDQPVEFAITADNVETPLIDVKLPSPAPAGINAVKLKQLGVHLKPGTPYQWSVSVVRNGDARSADLVASGYVEFASGKPKPATADAAGQAGLWYDAVDLTAGQPATARAALLEQVGLGDVAAYVRGH
jgi:hypothetical protein